MPRRTTRLVEAKAKRRKEEGWDRLSENIFNEWLCEGPRDLYKHCKK
jgi:hypothetical protein